MALPAFEVSGATFDAAHDEGGLYVEVLGSPFGVTYSLVDDLEAFYLVGERRVLVHGASPDHCSPAVSSECKDQMQYCCIL